MPHFRPAILALLVIALAAFALPRAVATDQPDPAVAELIKKLSTQISPAGKTGYSAAMHAKLAACLPHLDPMNKADQELLANARAFAAGQISGEVFAVYFREAHLRPAKRRMELIERPAKGGDAAAMFELAAVHHAGFDGKRDLPASIEWLTKAAQAGHLPAIDHLADLYRQGHGGVARNDARALALHHQAAKAGSLWSMLMLSDMLAHGRGTSDGAPDQHEAGRWLAKVREGAKKAAEAGEAQGMFILGYLLIDDGGRGLETDHAKALPWYEKAAALGHPRAMNSLAYLYAMGMGVDRNDEAAIKWWTRAAALDNIDAMQWLARIHRDGANGLKLDYVKSMQWYLAAADQGSAFAMNEVGYLHDAGLGVPVDYQQAINWYRKAADLNHAKGTNNIGVLHEFGKGLPRDPAQAATWYRKAIELGDRESMYHLGRLHDAGNGVPQDSNGAERLMRRAAALGEQRAQEWLKSKGLGADDDL